jgi:hypothetical protein
MVCLNAIEVGIGADIIDRAKLLRDKINSRIGLNSLDNFYYAFI